jgi:hypothetical protein
VLWWIIAGFFFWLSFREVLYGFVPRRGFSRPNPEISIPFVLATALLAIAFAYTPVRYWHFERFLTKKAQILAESNKATIHCNTLFDTWFDSNVFAAGHAQFETGRIVFQHPWCGRLMDHLKRPENPTSEELFSLQVFVHEAMHIRGERNEANTECQAIQRHVRGAKLLGIPDNIAKANGMTFYTGYYKNRAGQGIMSSQYYSDQCAPGKALDEKLADSTWG